MEPHQRRPVRTTRSVCALIRNTRLGILANDPPRNAYPNLGPATGRLARSGSVSPHVGSPDWQLRKSNDLKYLKYLKYLTASPSHG